MITCRVADLVAQGTLRVEDGNHGNDRPRPDEFVAEGVAFIRAADMSSGVVDYGSASKINSLARARIRKGIGAPGDVLLSHKGTVGKVAVAPDDAPEFVCSPQTTLWRSLDPTVIHQRFLRYVLVSPHFARQLDVLKGQTDMAPYVSLTDQRSMSLALPRIEAQQAIAEVLGALDDKLTADARKLRLADALCAAHVRCATLKGSEVRLRDVLTLHYGKALPATRRRTGDVAVLGSGGPVGFHNESIVDRSGVVLGRKGTVGAVYWADGPHFPIDTTYFIEPTREISSATLFYVLRSMRLQELNGDSAVPGLNREEAYAQIVRIPRKDEVAFLDRVLQANFACMRALRRETTALRETRDALLPLLMSGKVRVTDAEKLVEEAV